MGKHCVFVYSVQHAQRESVATRGSDATGAQAGASKMATFCPHYFRIPVARELAAFRRSRVVECRPRELMPPEAGGQFAQDALPEFAQDALPEFAQDALPVERCRLRGCLLGSQIQPDKPIRQRPRVAQPNHARLIRKKLILLQSFDAPDTVCAATKTSIPTEA